MVVQELDELGFDRLYLSVISEVAQGKNKRRVLNAIRTNRTTNAAHSPNLRCRPPG